MHKTITLLGNAISYKLQYHPKFQVHRLKGTTIISTPQNFMTSSSPTFI